MKAGPLGLVCIAALQEGYYKAFDVKEGDKMYQPPEKRVSIW
ncbi:hypothetical protein [Nevskia soli]|nr:hypothetical protein [Nevskia soli]